MIIDCMTLHVLMINCCVNQSEYAYSFKVPGMMLVTAH